MADDRAGKQNHWFVGALVERFRHFSDLFLHLVALISVLKLFTPQITGKVTGSILAGREQVSALGGGGRERPSGRQPPPAKLLRLYQTAQGSVSDRPARVGRRPQKTESTSHKTNASHMNAETSQHERRVDHDHNRPEGDPETDVHSLRRCPALSASARRESVVLPELVSAHRPQDRGVRTSPGR
jgi:hypothetical protein